MLLPAAAAEAVAAPLYTCALRAIVVVLVTCGEGVDISVGVEWLVHSGRRGNAAICQTLFSAELIIYKCNQLQHQDFTTATVV